MMMMMMMMMMKIMIIIIIIIINCIFPNAVLKRYIIIIQCELIVLERIMSR